MRFPILMVLVLVPVLLLGLFGARRHRLHGVGRTVSGRTGGLMGIGCLAGIFVLIGMVLLSYVSLRKVSVPPASTIAVTVKPDGKEIGPERPLSPAPDPLPEPPVMLRPSVVVKETPRPPEDPPVVAVTSQWWADREQACRQASSQLLTDLVALRTETEQRFLAKPEHLRAVAAHLEWSGEVEATEKDFGNGLQATMYRVHLRVPSQEKFVAELGGAMRANSEEIRLIAVGAGFFNVTLLFAFLGWLFKRKPGQVAQPVAV